MKNNGFKSHLKAKENQIKVNRKLINSNINNINLNKAHLSQNNYQNYPQNKNKLFPEENKNLKYQEYLEPTSYVINNVFTEYDSPKYTIYPFNTFKLNNLPPNDERPIYNNTNGNINKEKSLHLKNKNKLNYGIFNNYTNRGNDKIRKITSYKGYKKSNIISNNLNINSKSLINQGLKNNNKYGRKENQNSLNLISKNKYQTYNNKNNNIIQDNNNNNNNNDALNINFSRKVPNRNMTIKNYNIISPVTNHNLSTKKKINQNKNNLNFIHNRKNNTILSPEAINRSNIPTMKTSNSNNYYKSETDNMYTYNSCSNFYQRSNKNITKKNNNNMLNTINNFGYLNSSNSIDHKKNKLYESMNMNIDEINRYRNKNKLNYINIIENDSRQNTENNKDINNKNYTLNNNNNRSNLNINNLKHKKGKLSENNINIYINRRNNFQNTNNNKIIIYKKKLIEEFCHCLEEFIFMNVKNNFDTFILKLKNYCKDKQFNNLLLKRLRNKNVQKNFYKEKSSSYKYLDPNLTNTHYSSIIMMNNSNIINVERKGDYISNDFPKEFYERKTVYNFRNNNSPPLTEKMQKIHKNFRSGKSQDPLDINIIDNYNYNYYNNNTYFHNNNLLQNYTNFNNCNTNSNYKRRNSNINELNNINDIINNEDEEERKSNLKYETNYNDNNNGIYIPKKLKTINKNKNNRGFSKSNERQRNTMNDSEILNPYINRVKVKRIVSNKLSPQHEINRSQDINNDIIRAKIKKNYNINHLKKNNSINYNNSQDYNLNYNIQNKNNEFILNKTNDVIIKRNYTQMTYGNTYDNKANDTLPIYKKKINITQPKSKIYMNKPVKNTIRNKMIKINNNKTAEHLLSPSNLDKNKNMNINTNENMNLVNLNNSKNENNIRNVNTEPKIEINNINNINNLNNNIEKEIQIKKIVGKIKELTVNLSKKDNIIKDKFKDKDKIREKDNIIKDNDIKDNNIKDNNIKDNNIKDNIITDNNIKDNIIKDNNLKDNNLKDNLSNNDNINSNVKENEENINKIEEKDKKDNIDDNKILKKEEEPINQKNIDKENEEKNKNDSNKDEINNDNKSKDNKTENNENNENNNENNENNNNNTETITITNNNENTENNDNYNALSNDNNIINDDTDESDENVTKEIIVKDVSTRDKRLNVFIKYVELSKFNTINNEFKNRHLINSFQTDSIYIHSLYSKQNTNYYYNNYYYGNKNNKNNKLKLHKILSSIIEEEEKSKAAGSINNSLLSEEDINKGKNGNNYSHFFIQSIKYVSNYLQSIFDDKKKDMYFQFIKTLKKIKNESFLRGLINQKKYQTLNKLKDDEKDKSKIENNNYSEDNSSSVILYNANDNFNMDNNNNYLENKNQNQKTEKNPENKENNENEKKMNEDEDNNDNNSNTSSLLNVSEKKYSSANNLSMPKEEEFEKKILKRNKSCYPFDYIEVKENNSFSFLDSNKQKEDNNNPNLNKLRQIIENLDEYKNWKLIEKAFKIWKKMKNVKKEIILDDRKDDYEMQIDYEKNVTISEACRGLSDVILDFKMFLIKYCLKNKNE